MQHDERIRRKVVDERGRRIEEQRQVILDAAGNDARGNILVERRARRVAFEDFAEATAKPGAAGVVERKFARRQEPHVTHRIEASLRVGVEGADRLDFVAEQVEPVRQRRAHRVEVDQAPAHAEFAGRDDLRDVRVAGESELRAQRVHVEPLALREKERMRGEE